MELLSRPGPIKGCRASQEEEEKEELNKIHLA
jgi:hypothetical protein